MRHPLAAAREGRASGPRPQRAPGAASRFTLRVGEPFELRVALFGHGWIDLAPHEWDRASGTWRTVLLAGARAVDVEARQQDGAVRVRCTAAGAGALNAMREGLRRMLRLDLDLEPFWAVCDAEPRLRWVRSRGAGRMLRSAAAFEDLMKLLLTTNCSWAATRLMVSRLVAELGAKAPSGKRAFPTAAACTERGEAFWRDVVRAGYRARACAALARAFATGGLTDEHFTDAALDAAALRERLLELDGFGPYAAGQALRLFGHHEDLALDSWCRATYARLVGKRRPPSDAAIARAYRRFGSWQGLALWMDLTAPWHAEKETTEITETTERDG